MASTELLSAQTSRAFSERAPERVPDPALWPSGGMRVEPLAFRRAPLLFAAVWFCVGAGVSRVVWQPPAVWLAAFGLLAGLTAISLRGAGRVVLVPAAAVWMTLGLAATEMQPGIRPQQALLAMSDGLVRQVRGRVVRVRRLPPRTAQDEDSEAPWNETDETEPASDVSFDLQVEAVEEVTPDVSHMVPVEGGLRAVLLAGTGGPELHCGDVVEAPMRMRVPDRFRDPGAWQYADYLLVQGIGAQATLHGGAMSVERPGQAGGLLLRCRLFAAQSWAAGRMEEYGRSHANRSLPAAMRLTGADIAMLDAMLFGDRTALTHTLRLGFERTGSFHLFVVSGIHVGLIAWGLFAVARRLRMGQVGATAATLLCTGGYAALTGFAIPVQRALWMAGIFLVARLLDRSRNTLNALGLAVLAVLAWSPRSLFEASFQMSFLALVAVAGVALPLGERTFLRYARACRRLEEPWLDVGFAPREAELRVLLRMAGESCGRVLRVARGLPAALVRVTLWGMELMLVALVAEAVMVLPMAVYFHRATVFSLPANALTIPILAVLVPSALLLFVASLAGPWVGMVPAAVTGLLLHSITGVIGRLSGVQLADLRTPGPATGVCLVAVGLYAVCCWAVRTQRLGNGMAVALSGGLLMAAAALVLWPEPVARTAGMLEVTALDVGQGDSVLVVGPDGRTLLVDAGGPIGSHGSGAARAAVFDVGEEVVAPYLWSRRIGRLDAVALTHEHSDHMGGMPAVLRAMRPRELWVGTEAPSQAYASLLREAAALGIRVRSMRAGDGLDWGGVRVSVLGPETSYRTAGAPRNDDSLVLRLQFGAASVLLEGDAEAAEERGMLAHERVSGVTLLKVGHHGSSTSSTEAFLEAASPREAVISVGRGNPFGHPRGEVIARLAERKTVLYRTDMHGLTTFLLSRDGGIRAGEGAY